MTPAISVLLTIYKEPNHWVKDAVLSILQQTFTDFELILLVDNPENIKLIKFLGNYTTDPRIRLVIHNKNLGLPKSLNRGISLARGRYIARLDADDIALPQRLQGQFRYLEAHPAVDLCGGQFVKIDEKGRHLGQSNNPVHSDIIAKLLPYVNVVAHPTWMIRRSVFSEIGLYRDLPNAEDFEFLNRMQLSKKRMVNLSEPLIKYRHHDLGQTGKSLEIKTCGIYIREKYLSAKRTGIYSFGHSELAALIQENEKKYANKHRIASSLHASANVAFQQGQYFRGAWNLVKAALACPIQRGHYSNLSKALFLRKIGSILLKSRQFISSKILFSFGSKSSPTSTKHRMAKQS